MIRAPRLKKSSKLSAKGYVSWINKLLDTEISSIEELSNGVAYCKLLNFLFPGLIDTRKVQTEGNCGDNNFRIIEKCLKRFSGDPKIDINSVADINKAISGGYTDNYRLAFYFHMLFEANIDQLEPKKQKPKDLGSFHVKNATGMRKSFEFSQKQVNERSKSIPNDRSDIHIQNLIDWFRDYQDRHKESENIYLYNRIAGFQNEFYERVFEFENLKTTRSKTKLEHKEVAAEYENAQRLYKKFKGSFEGRLEDFKYISDKYYNEEASLESDLHYSNFSKGKSTSKIKI